VIKLWKKHFEPFFAIQFFSIISDSNAKLKDFKEEPWSYKDGNRWIGFCVDLMQKLSEILRIKFVSIKINEMGIRANNSDPDAPPSFSGVLGQVFRGVRLTNVSQSSHKFTCNLFFPGRGYCSCTHSSHDRQGRLHKLCRTLF
jgi:hypothetical protein